MSELNQTILAVFKEIEPIIQARLDAFRPLAHVPEVDKEIKRCEFVLREIAKVRELQGGENDC